MNERLLQFIWQYQYFNKSDLKTTDAQSINIIKPGMLNVNQGPDFLNAQVKIGDTLWAGSIEIHINATDWDIHKHSADKHYNNVVLHVVWNDDSIHALPFPTFEIKDKVSKILLNKYHELMHGAPFIPCERLVGSADPLIITAWTERLLVERLQQKTESIELLMKNINRNWEEICWRLLSRTFGIKVNSDAFEEIAQSIPLKILTKHKESLLQLEALLMGQAGLLEKDFTEKYPAMLQKEYRFLQKKYQLTKVHTRLNFLRMRPANFPTVRLAQLASLIHNQDRIFSGILEADIISKAEKIFSITANDYWHYHYQFDIQTGYKQKIIGKQMTRIILLNTVIPLLYTYGHLNKLEKIKNKAMDWMEKLAPEKNQVTLSFEKLGLENKSAGVSQAIIHLKQTYCDEKRCLQCAIGMNILKVN